MSRRLRIFRWIIRFCSLGAAVFLLVGGPLPLILSGVLPALSPLGRFTAVISGKTWYPALFWGLPAVLFLGLALWRGRVFCRWFCPTGVIGELARPISLRRPLVKRRYAGIVFWGVIAASAFGLPLAMIFDPLSAFQRLGHIGHGMYTMTSLIPGAVVPLILIAGVCQPSVWCTHICPLGYLFQLCRVKSRSSSVAPDNIRRDLVKGVFIGTPIALLGRYLNPIKDTAQGRSNSALQVLPPGAGNIDRFSGLCIRCYACVTACPTRVISVKYTLSQPMNHIFQPCLDMTRGYCAEFCTECLKVCPTGAIQRFPLEEKRNLQLGIAKVHQEICLSWSEGEHCMVCQEHCSYNAIESDPTADGLPRPVVLEDLCRGCGACQNKCPALTNRAAIRVEGVTRQRKLEGSM